MKKSVAWLTCAMGVSLLNACVNDLERWTTPPFSINEATSMTDEQAKAVISTVLAHARARQSPSAEFHYMIAPVQAQFYDQWPANPSVKTYPICEEIKGFEKVKKIAFENLEFGFSPEEDFYGVFSIWKDLGENNAGCSDKPAGAMIWRRLTPDEARQMSAALYALGAKPWKNPASQH